ncbi:hypothetical protein [Pseudorhizobium flavum]|uniref:Uncharacterized protein n=1 Tax=Pseudorhizobium flavum TaxID=1335061 RepID=A0A7W9YWS1_9HYPH|nr:hypothetical protein [Pseudorhizobium flavum]MBB6179832.1 hypothetical protein [Pseudorhizobium flavum]CAD6597059.1 hypothetical protein RFYW14_00450 [Pseudorhizobium flavum]
MTISRDIFWYNAAAVVRDMGMPHLNPPHGAAVDAVRWCLLVQGRPTHLRQEFLEKESPQLLAYLEKLAHRGDAAGWRTLRDRIQFRAEILSDTGIQPCSRPWLAAIWHTLPELAALGQVILDHRGDDQRLSPDPRMPTSAADAVTAGEGDGAAGKTGSSAAAKPGLSPRLVLPFVVVVPTPAEEKALDLSNDRKKEVRDDTAPDGPEGFDGPDGPGRANGPAGPGGRR